MSTATENLITEIVEIARDYKGTVFNNGHVSKWLSQFPENHHGLILNELHSILSKTYFSKQMVIEMFRATLKNDAIFVNPIEEYKFINPQVVGSSQGEMLDIIENILETDYELTLDDCGKSEIVSYIYIDDAIYSGNRVIRDIQSWAVAIDNPSSVLQLDIIVLALHNRNLDYVIEQLKNALPKAEIKIWPCLKFYDNIWEARNKFESYWPSTGLEYNDTTSQYIERVKVTRTNAQNEKIPLLSNSNEPTSDKYFSSLKSRKAVEKLFFEKGVEIVTYASNPNQNMRPMGYDNSKTLGFGSYFVTYRNIANNCPVVLWWGDLNATAGINNWYPLFPRITN